MRSMLFLDMNNNISHHGTSSQGSYIVQVEMHLKKLNVANDMLPSNHIEIIFFENYNRSLYLWKFFKRNTKRLKYLL